MADSATPDAGTESKTPPQDGGLMSEQDAIDAVASRLDPADEPAPEREQERTPSATEAESEESGTEPAPEQEAGPEADQPDDVESEEAGPDEVEIPETLADLAEALELDPEAFGDHLRVKVKINGETSEVPVSEAVRGYQRQVDYDARNAELRDQRQAFDAERQTKLAEAEQRIQAANDLATVLAQRVQSQYSPETMERVLREEGYEAHYALEQRRKADIEALQAIHAQREQQKEQALGELQKHRVEQQRRLVSAVPDFADPEKGTRLQQNMARYLQGRGFSDEEIGGYFNGAFDHRYVQVILDAQKYRALQQSKPSVTKTVKAKPIMKKAGKAMDKSERSANNRSALRDRLKKAGRTGSRQQSDAAAFALVRNLIE